MYVPKYYKIEKDVDSENKVFRPLPNRLGDPFVVAHRGNNSAGAHSMSDMNLSEDIKICNKTNVVAECCNYEYQAFNNLSKRRSQAIHFDTKG
jgi:hypothetical protein